MSCTKIKFFPLLAFAVAPSLLAALEIKEALIKLVVNEQTSRVSLYSLIDIAKSRYEALLFDQDPRTTFATLSLDGKQYRLGDSAEFRSTVMRTETGARIEFRSASCVVSQDIEFINTEGAALSDGVKMSFTIENVSQKDEAIGLRLLLDTWLGEKSGKHFRTDVREHIGEESYFDSKSADTWISTPGEKSDLMIILASKRSERAEGALFANWKRLNDEPWFFTAAPGRNFTLLPYSVNDSAVALYWQPANLSRGATRKASLILCQFNPKGYSTTVSRDASTEALFSQTVLALPGADPKAALASDLVSVRDLISRIDRALSSGTAPGSDELQAWRKILDKLEERAKGY